ncbi:MAG: cupin domain-containing protein [Rhodopila sp.]
MIRHHPSDATLMAYAGGTLPEGLAVVLATHLTQCPTCRSAIGAAETMGGLLLESLPPAEMAMDFAVVERLLERADDEPPRAPPVLNPGLAPPLDRVRLGRWWPVGRGIRWRFIEAGGAAMAGLVHVQPGRSIPRHGHVGLELTCLLSGVLVDAGVEYHHGDIAEPASDHDSPPVATGDEPCVCAVAFEGMRFRGVLGLVQRLGGW